MNHPLTHTLQVLQGFKLPELDHFYIIIDEETKEAYTSINGAARICGVDRQLIQYQVSRKETPLEEVEILTTKGKQRGKRISEDLLMELIDPVNTDGLAQEGSSVISVNPDGNIRVISQ